MVSNSDNNDTSIVHVGSAGLTKVNNALRITENLLNSFDSVVIGEQEWMTRNLNVSKFRNGDLIPEIQNDEEWEKAGQEGHPAWCYYDNDCENGKIYGKLYNWHAVNDSRDLAPIGWRIPRPADWTELRNFYNENDFVHGEADLTVKVAAANLRAVIVAGGKMKTIGTIEDGSGLWKSPNDGATNDSGLSMRPGGKRSKKGRFDLIHDKGCWWSSNEDSIKKAKSMQLFHNYSWFGVGNFRKSQGHSIRCILKK